MRRMRTTLAALTLALADPAAAGAQATPSPGFRVSVRVTALQMDTTSGRVTVSYRVLNTAASTDSLKVFRVDAPTGQLRVAEPSDSWFADTQYVGRPIASWTLLGRSVRPGERTPTLTLEAPGVPGIVRYWAERQEPPNWVASADDDPPGHKEPSIESQLAHNSDMGFTVGVVRPPTDRSDIGLAKHVRLLTRRSCQLGWIGETRSCDSLAAKLDGESPRWQDFMRQLDAQRATHIDDAAYFLLRGNVEFVLARRR